jgi:hypothetical protein
MAICQGMRLMTVDMLSHQCRSFNRHRGSQRLESAALVEAQRMAQAQRAIQFSA